MSSERLLIVEDDNEIGDILDKYLKGNGYDTDRAYNGIEAINKIEEEDFSLVLLDIMLPFKSGDQVLQKVRETKQIPVIIISAKDMIQTKIDVMRMGADDYVTKPFDLDEVLVRIEAVLRRTVGNLSGGVSSSKKEVIKHKNIEMDRDAARVLVKGQSVTLTSKEYAILELFLTNPNKIFSKTNIYESIWDDTYIYDDNTLMVHISNLRNKLKDIDSEEEYIETIWGMGYRLAE
ncbi:DNA-binding response regulator, OmpR family, contains REC and winged-helix (wHTH) domain [Lachnospiraceae bacterium]|nr:DNA-binding response regulator, OmpR family, contains REC and winged-helix (wHTH) domain [Lachnospiraceae bacterium]